MLDQAKAADSTLSPARRSAVLGVACLGVLLVVSAIASINVALPEIGTQLHASQTDLQWIVDAYTVTLAALLLPAGAIGDRYGRKATLLVGLVLFGGSSLAGALATDPGLLIAARAALGVGAALLFPCTLSLITTSYPAEERTRATAIWAGVCAVGAVIGLVAVGGLLHFFWWGSLFVLNVIGSIVCIVAAVLVIPNGQREKAVRLDPPGALLAVISVGALVYGIIEGPTQGWTDLETVAPIVLGLVAGIAFIDTEFRSPAPMLDPRIFADRTVSAGSLLITMQFFGGFAFFFVMTQYLQYILGYSPLKGGLALAPVAALILIGSVGAVALARRVGLRVLAAGGLALMAGGCAVAAACDVDSSYWPVPAVAMGLLGAGLGISTAVGTSAITEGLPREKQGVASALNDTTRELGAALGIAAIGSFLNAGYRSSFDDGAGALPAPIADVARDGFGAAQEIAKRQPDSGVLDVARAAVVHGLAVSLTACAIVLVIGAAVVARLAPRRVAEPVRIPLAELSLAD